MIERFNQFLDNNREKVQGASFLIGGVVIACFAQLTLVLSLNQPGFWDISKWAATIGANSSPLSGLLLYILAGWFFIRGCNILENKFANIDIPTTEKKNLAPRFGFWITSAGLSLFTSFYAVNNSSEANASVTFTWLISIIFFAISVLIYSEWKPITGKDLLNYFYQRRVEALILLVIILVAFFIRFQNVEFHPYAFINDEGEMGKNGECIFSGKCQNLFDFGWAGQSNFAFLPTAISILLFGRTAIAVRLVSVAWGTLAVLFTYLFTREVLGKKQALIAASILATLPFHVHFSRIGVDNIIDSISSAAILWLFFRALKYESTILYMLAGIIGGLCFATYPGSRLAPMIVVFCMVVLCIYYPKFIKTQKHNFVIFIFALAITAAPFISFFVSQPDGFSARMKSEGIFWNNIYQNQLADGKTGLEILSDQFFRSSLVFILTPAPYNFYNSPNPYLTDLAAILFMIGLAYTLRRLLDIRYLTILIWFWITVILGSTITGGPPTNQRMLMSTPALSIIIAIGLSTIFDLIPLNGKYFKRISNTVILSLVLMIGYQNLAFYFKTYRNGFFFEDPANEITYETKTAISSLHEKGRLYFIGTPDVPYLLFASIDYFSPDVEKKYLNEINSNILTMLPTDKDALFIATPDRKSDLLDLVKFIPGGILTDFDRRNHPNETLFLSYKVSKSLLNSINP